MDDERRVILARRAKLLVASLAGLSLGVVDCGRDTKSNAPATPPEPPTSSIPAAASAPPVASVFDAGVPRGDDKDASAEISVDAGPDAQASASPSASTSARPPPKKAPPPPRKPQPQVCLSPYDIVGNLEAEEQWRKKR